MIDDDDSYASLRSWLWLLRQHEREEAEMRLRAGKGPVFYCAGKGAPVVTCHTMDEFRRAQGPSGPVPKGCAS